jgi:hypothetical protein
MMIHRRLLLAGLVVLLSSRALAQPAGATLISPAAAVVGSTITFTWHSAPGATWYHFWLGRADTTLVTEHWYTAEHAGCATGGTCAIVLTPPITAGAFVWHIRTWNASGYGPWSPAHMFTVRDVTQAWSGQLPPSRRFTLVLEDAAVLDNETGLVWQRQHSAVAYGWVAVHTPCANVVVGRRLGWRAPTLAELTSVLEHNGSIRQLPTGHPFLISSPGTYWTLTMRPDGQHYITSLPDVDIALTGDEVTARRVWCVRGPSTAGQ